MSERWSWIPHLWGLLTPIITIAGLVLGGWWMASGILLLLGIYPLLDLVLGVSSNTHPLQEGRAHNVIVHLHALGVLAAVGVLFWRLSLDGLTGLTFLGMLSAGLNNGASGIVAAHELGHRRPKSASWWLSRLTLFSVVYAHFTTEHNHTHHRHWAKDRDPTSSPWGRSVYAHILRTVPKQVKGAFNARPEDTKRVFALEAGFIGTLAVLAWPLAVGFLIQAIAAIYLLEFVNYLQHHGLRRQDDERPNATHAWESRHRLSRWTLMELPLHPSHHLKASTRYERLDVHDESPQLPFGYYVMFWVAHVPPLFGRLLRRQAKVAGLPV